jgi:hypothetical protein
VGDGAVRWLPQVEYPDAQWSEPGLGVRPAGFGPLEPTHPLRQSRSGTYDQRWLERHYPEIAPDTDWRFFNRAFDDQQQGPAFRGDESYRFLNLHPHAPRLDGRLPGLCARVFATRSSRPDAIEEVELSLRALWFFPDQERLIQVFQGTLPVEEDDAADITHLLTAVERLGQRRTRHHYRQVRDKRLDRDKGLLEALRETDLVPEDLVVPLFDPRRPRARGSPCVARSSGRGASARPLARR